MESKPLEEVSRDLQTDAPATSDFPKLASDDSEGEKPARSASGLRRGVELPEMDDGG